MFCLCSHLKNWVHKLKSRRANSFKDDAETLRQTLHRAYSIETDVCWVVNAWGWALWNYWFYSLATRSWHQNAICGCNEVLCTVHRMWRHSYGLLKGIFESLDQMSGQIFFYVGQILLRIKPPYERISNPSFLLNKTFVSSFLVSFRLQTFCAAAGYIKLPSIELINHTLICTHLLQKVAQILHSTQA